MSPSCLRVFVLKSPIRFAKQAQSPHRETTMRIVAHALLALLLSMAAQTGMFGKEDYPGALTQSILGWLESVIAK